MSTAQSTKAAKKAAQAALHAPVAAQQEATPNSVGNKAMEFATQQLTAPVAPVQQEVIAPVADITQTPEFVAALATALANRVPATKATKAPTTPRAKRLEQNGIKRPLAGNGICATMWATFDSISAAQKSPCTIAQAKAAMPTFNVVNMQGEYASWRKFNGITGRIVATVVVPVVAPVDTATVADLQESNVL